MSRPLPSRVFRNGNSQAVRIPAELAFGAAELEVVVERVGDELRIRPLRGPLTGVLERFQAFSEGFMADGGEQEEQADRESL